MHTPHHRAARAFAAALLVAAATTAAAQPPATPQPTVNLIGLTNFQGLASIFTLGRGTVRLIAVVSPSDSTSRNRIEDIAGIMSRWSTPRLRAHIVFAPLTESDHRLRALMEAGRFADARVVYYWDADNVAGEALAAITGDDDPAFNTFFLFDTDVGMSPSYIPDPVLWMRGSDERPAFDARALEARMAALLETLERKRRDAPSQR